MTPAILARRKRTRAPKRTRHYRVARVVLAAENFHIQEIQARIYVLKGGVDARDKGEPGEAAKTYQ